MVLMIQLEYLQYILWADYKIDYELDINDSDEDGIVDNDVDNGSISQCDDIAMNLSTMEL